jgi:hypothetical protein
MQSGKSFKMVIFQEFKVLIAFDGLSKALAAKMAFALTGGKRGVDFYK